MNKLILIALLALAICQNDLNKAELEAHNIKRRLHKDTPDLAYCEECAKHAQEYAEKLCIQDSVRFMGFVKEWHKDLCKSKSTKKDF